MPFINSSSCVHCGHDNVNVAQVSLGDKEAVVIVLVQTFCCRRWNATRMGAV